MVHSTLIPKYDSNFSYTTNLDIWTTDTSACNNGTAYKKGMMNLRKDESSSGTMGVLGNAVRNCYFVTLLTFLQQYWSRRDTGHY